MNERISRVNSLLVRELGKLIAREVEFPKSAVVTVTKAEATPDLAEATVSVSVLPDDQGATVLRLLERRRYDLQRLLNRTLVMRNVPKIAFQLDRTEAGAARIDSLLDELSEKP